MCEIIRCVFECVRRRGIAIFLETCSWVTGESYPFTLLRKHLHVILCVYGSEQHHFKSAFKFWKSNFVLPFLLFALNAFSSTTMASDCSEHNKLEMNFFEREKMNWWYRKMKCKRMNWTVNTLSNFETFTFVSWLFGWFACICFSLIRVENLYLLIWFCSFFLQHELSQFILELCWDLECIFDVCCDWGKIHEVIVDLLHAWI